MKKHDRDRPGEPPEWAARKQVIQLPDYKAAGMNMTDVVAVTGYLGDMSDYPRYNEIYQEHFKVGSFPTRATVAAKELARGVRIEVTMIAVRSQ